MPKLKYPKKHNPKSYYINPKIEARASKLHGVGVYAKKDIKKHEVLEECHFVLLKTDWKSAPKPLWEYIFAWTKELPDSRSKAALVFGLGAVYNSSNKNNADWKTDKKRNRFVYYAIKKIKKGSEILIDYGSEYWDTREIKYKKEK